MLKAAPKFLWKILANIFEKVLLFCLPDVSISKLQIFLRDSDNACRF